MSQEKLGDRTSIKNSEVTSESTFVPLTIDVPGAPMKLLRHIVAKFEIVESRNHQASLSKINQQLTQLFGTPLTGQDVKIIDSTIHINEAFIGKVVTLSPKIPFCDENIPALLASVSDKINKKRAGRLLHPNQACADLDLFIEPKVSNDLQQRSGGQIDPIDTKVLAFLRDPEKRSLLLLGDSGSGKSLYCQHLWEACWKDYSVGKPIPLFIELPRYERPDNDLIHAHVVDMMFTYDLSVPECQAILTQPLICILDGYDEMTLPRGVGEAATYPNLYRSNALKNWRGVKVITTCRSQALTKLSGNYQTYFYPQDGHGDKPSAFEQWVIRPFRKAQEIMPYIEKYVDKRKEKDSETLWDVTRYEQAIEQIPNLYELMGNPFMLYITLAVLPSLDIGKAAQGISRWGLYRAYTERHFRRVADQLKKEGRVDASDAIELDFSEFSTELACALYEEGIEKIVFQTLAKRRWGSSREGARHQLSHERFKRFFVGEDVDLVRSGCMLRVLGQGEYGFYHKSLWEYFVSKKMVVSLEKLNTETLEGLGAEETKHLFNTDFITKERGILDFLSDYVSQQEGEKREAWESKLLRIVRSSRDPEHAAELEAGIPGFGEVVERAASNAITLLNAVQYNFSPMNLSHIKIPYSDLRNGKFHGVNLGCSKISKSNLTGCWLVGANLDNVDLNDVELGRRTILDRRKKPDLRREIYAAHYNAFLNTVILYYRTSEVEIIDCGGGATLNNFKSRVIHYGGDLSSSKSNAIIVTCEEDHGATVYLHHVQTNQYEKALKIKPRGYVKHISVSPNGNFLFLFSLFKGQKNPNIYRIYRLEKGIITDKHKIPLVPYNNCIIRNNGDIILIENNDFCCRRFEDGYQQRYVLLRHINKFSMSSNGKSLITLNRSNEIQTHEVNDESLLKIVNTKNICENNDRVRFLRMSFDGKYGITLNDKNILKVWDLTSKKIYYSFEIFESVKSVFLTNSNEIIVVHNSSVVVSDIINVGGAFNHSERCDFGCVDPSVHIFGGGNYASIIRCVGAFEIIIRDIWAKSTLNHARIKLPKLFEKEIEFCTDDLEEDSFIEAYRNFRISIDIKDDFTIQGMAIGGRNGAISIYGPASEFECGLKVSTKKISAISYKNEMLVASEENSKNLLHWKKKDSSLVEYSGFTDLAGDISSICFDETFSILCFGSGNCIYICSMNERVYMSINLNKAVMMITINEGSTVIACGSNDNVFVLKKNSTHWGVSTVQVQSLVNSLYVKTDQQTTLIVGCKNGHWYEFCEELNTKDHLYKLTRSTMGNTRTQIPRAFFRKAKNEESIVDKGFFQLRTRSFEREDNEEALLLVDDCDGSSVEESCDGY